MELPNNPAMLLSAVNMLLRDEGCSLDELCERRDLCKDEIVETLKNAGFEYSEEYNKFW